MSFGFSVGDFVAGAQLAYTLCQALSDSKGSAREYQELIAQLDVVHKVLLQVDQLRAAKQLAQATVNALLFTVNSTNAAMERFIEQNEAYHESLKPGGSGNSIKDLFRKAKWGTQMSEKVRDLKMSLAAMLAATNCLVSLACYYNTGYDPKCMAEISLCAASPGAWWNHIKLEMMLLRDADYNYSGHLGFEEQMSPEKFFRPGQIFAAQITSSVRLDNNRGFRNVDFGHLPLEPTEKLMEIAAQEFLEDKERRLVQIQNLPLPQITLYCKELLTDCRRVECLLCNGHVFEKERWAVLHFRIDHWKYYFAMLQGWKKRFRKRGGGLVSASDLAKPDSNSDFSSENWIILDDITEAQPIPTDQKIYQIIVNTSRISQMPWAGPVMIQRFVVISEDKDECLCLGIHTYARTGCGAQPDQELFAILHSGKEVPQPFPDETKMVLHPIRMKPEHPSTALPRSARIHFGRAYGIVHGLPVQPLGLVHPASMETFLDQFEVNVFRKDNEQMERSRDDEDDDEDDYDLKSTENSSFDADVVAADIEIVKDMRQSIIKVLGSDLSPAQNPPPQALEED